MEKKKETKKTTSKTTKKKTIPTKKSTNTTIKKISSKKKKKGFTLIELLAVIIILGILMIIAIPSVTSYISDSRKSAYVDTAMEIVNGARNVVNEGKLGMYDTSVTYYIPADYINTENALKSPYGEFTQAYVGVTYDGKGYKYYWISVDDAGQGIEDVTALNDLDTDKIKSDLKSDDILDRVKTTGIDGKNNIYVLTNGEWNGPYQSERAPGDDIESNSGPKTAAQIISKVSGLRNVAGAKRYYGADPNNYVTFNNGELWRIIGVYNNQLKIIKAEPIGNQKWASTSNNTWPASDIKNYLYNTYYPSIDATSRNMIDENATWFIGPAYRMDNASEAYDRAKDSTWTGKIGLFAIYEYLYAANDECLTKGGHQFDSCSDWIFTTLINNGPIFRAWSINKGYNLTYDAMLVYRSNKQVDSHGMVDPIGTTPVVYLKSTVMLSGGTGTSGDPYVLE